MTGINAARHRVTNWTLHPDVKKPAEINHDRQAVNFGIKNLSHEGRGK